MTDTRCKPVNFAKDSDLFARPAGATLRLLGTTLASKESKVDVDGLPSSSSAKTCMSSGCP